MFSDWSCGSYDASTGSTYTEVLQVVDGDFVAKEMDQSILEHASVTVPVIRPLAEPFREPEKNSHIRKAPERCGSAVRATMP
jgi:hypothetical protein